VSLRKVQIVLGRRLGFAVAKGFTQCRCLPVERSAEELSGPGVALERLEEVLANPTIDAGLAKQLRVQLHKADENGDGQLSMLEYRRFVENSFELITALETNRQRVAAASKAASNRSSGAQEDRRLATKSLEQLNSVLDEFMAKITTQADTTTQRKVGRSYSLDQVLKSILQKLKQYPSLFGLVVLSITAISVCQSLMSIFQGRMLASAQANAAGTGTGKLASQFVLYVTFFVLSYVTRIIFSVFSARLTSKLVNAMRSQVVAHMCNGNSEFVLKFTPRRLLSTFSSDIARLEAMLSSFLSSGLGPAISTAVGMVSILIENPSTAVYFVGLIPVVFYFDLPGKVAAQVSAHKAFSCTKTNSLFQSLIEILPIARASNAGAFLDGKLAKPIDDLTRDTADGIMYASFMQNYFSFMLSGFQTVLIVSLVREVAIGEISSGLFVSVSGLISNLVSPLERMTAVQKQMISNGAFLRNVDEILEAVEMQEEGGADAALPKLAPLKKTIHISDVSFAYTPKSLPTLSKLQVTINAASYCVLCGGSGSGKSTLLSLMTRCHPTTAGSLLFDGVDVSTCSLATLRLQVGVVLQKVMIMPGSIEENISFGSGATQEQVVLTARQAEVHDEITAAAEG